ncbi:LPXTG cell wall anchor domain-containing protein [Streptomyces sp. NPDC057239]|uniref:LPXTG cell wall anchor domain-containing protein n=1 Tax=Streptomyces sp. NPDC057239 TaxID=3346061 RepID=UPI003640455D
MTLTRSGRAAQAVPSDLTFMRHEVGHVLGLDHTSGLDNNGTDRPYAGAFATGPHPSRADPAGAPAETGAPVGNLRGTPCIEIRMKSKRTMFGAVSAAVVLALAPGATAVADDPSPSPTQAYAEIRAGKQINVGPAAQPVHVSWGFWDGGAQVPTPTDETLVIDARDLAGIASVSADDPRCEADGRVFTCVNKESTQSRSVDFTLRAVTGATLGDTGTIKYTVTAKHGTGATATAKVVVGVPNLVVGKVPDTTHAAIGSRIDIPLRLRNTGDLATDRRIQLRWASEGGLLFDHKFSNCTYDEDFDPEPAGRTTVTCVVTAPVAVGATVELSSPLTAKVGKRVLTDVVDYSVSLLEPGYEHHAGDSPQGTGPELRLVPVSGAGGAFEKGPKGRFTVAADNSADFGATVEVAQDRWALDIRAVNHGPASVYVVDKKPVVVVDIVLPKGMVGSRNIYEEGEDRPYGECLVRVSSTETAPFEAGHRRYVCPVPFALTPGKSQLFVLRVKLTEDYDGAKGTATVRPGLAGVSLHDPDASNDSVTFSFDAQTTPTTTAPSDGTLPATGTTHTALVVTAGAGALLLGTVALVGLRRRRSH